MKNTFLHGGMFCRWIMTARCRDVGWGDDVAGFVKNEKTHWAM